MIGGTLLSFRQCANSWELQSRRPPYGMHGWGDNLKFLLPLQRIRLHQESCKKRTHPVLRLRETRSDAIKSLLYPDRNCLQEQVCTSGVPEMKIGGHCRVP